MSETNWNDLARRCEEATGADDHAVVAEVTKRIMFGLGYQPRSGSWWKADGGGCWANDANRIMVSLDAITALIERELPKVIIASGMNPKEHWGSEEPYGAWAALHPSEGDPPDDGYRADECATEALARCVALCRAMAHRSTPHA